MKALHCFLSFLILLSISINAHAAQKVVLYDDLEEEWVGSKRTMVFEDTSASLTLEEVLALDAVAPVFTEHTGSDAMNTNVNSNYWLRFLIVDKRTHNTNLLLELYDFDLEDMQLYSPLANGKYQKQVSGYLHPFNTRKATHKNINFSLPAPLNDSTYFYMCFHSSEVKMLEPVIRSYNRAYTYALKEYLFLGVFYGLMLLMIAYNLIYFIILKRSEYFFYILYALSSLLYLSTRDGLGFQFLWPNYPSVNLYMETITLFLAVVSLILLAKKFLDDKVTGKPLCKWFNIAIGIRSVLFVLELFVPIQTGLFDIIFIQVILALAFLARIRGNKASFWLIVAVIALDTAFTLSFLEKYNLIESNWFAVYSVNFGIVLQFIFLSISLAEAVKEAYRTQNKTQNRLITELKKNESLQEKINSELHKKSLFDETLMKISSSFINIGVDQYDGKLEKSFKEVAEFIDTDRAFLCELDSANKRINTTLLWYKDGLNVEEKSPKLSYAFDNVKQITDQLKAGNVVYYPDLKNHEETKSIRFLKQQLTTSTLFIPLMSSDECIGCMRFDAVRTPKQISGNLIDLLRLYAQILVDVYSRIGDQVAMTDLLTKTSDQNQRLKDFSFITSHNIRSSVSSLVGLVELSEVDEEMPGYKDMFKRLVQNLDQTISNTHQLLNLEQNNDSIEQETVNIHELLSKIIVQNEKLISSKKAKVQLEVPSELNIKTTLVYLESILYNIINNALKYGVTESHKLVIVRAEQSDTNEVLITVQDFGIGIDLGANQTKIFELGSQLNQNTEGQGLGLFMVKNQLKLLGGKIDVRSTPKQSTTFEIRLPIS